MTWNAENCRYFWANIKDTEEYFANRPSLYAQKNKTAPTYLHEFMKDYVSTGDSILELGCNAGGNLSWLHWMGYKNLAGIEINKTAIETCYKHFPQLANMPVACGAIEEILPQVQDDAVNVIFTMAVLMHIHPDSRHIYKHMSRIASKYVITFEDEQSNNEYVFDRSYYRIFTRLGCKQIKSKRLKGVYNYDNFVLRLFSTGENNG